MICARQQPYWWGIAGWTGMYKLHCNRFDQVCAADVTNLQGEERQASLVSVQQSPSTVRRSSR